MKEYNQLARDIRLKTHAALEKEKETRDFVSRIGSAFGVSIDRSHLFSPACADYEVSRNGRIVACAVCQRMVHSMVDGCVVSVDAVKYRGGVMISSHFGIANVDRNLDFIVFLHAGNGDFYYVHKQEHGKDNKVKKIEACNYVVEIPGKFFKGFPCRTAKQRENGQTPT